MLFGALGDIHGDFDGARRIAHLEGGLLAWANTVDPTFEVAPVG